MRMNELCEWWANTIAGCGHELLTAMLGIGLFLVGVIATFSLLGDEEDD